MCCAAVQPYVPETVDPILEPWRWRYEEALDGLGVLCMDEAEDGAFWFGCIGGLAHYDGHSVTRIPIDAQQLPNSAPPNEIPWVRSLMILEEDSLLVLVGQSLLLRRDGEWLPVLPNVGKGRYTDRMARSADGTIWLQVPGALWRISADLSEKTRVMKVALPRELQSFCFDEAGDIWVVEKLSALSSQLVYIPLEEGRAAARDTWREVAVPFVNTMSEARVVAGPGGQIWYADSSNNSGLERFDPQTERWIDSPKDASSKGVYSLVTLPDGAIFGGRQGGIVYLPPDGNLRVYARGKLDLPIVPLSLFKSRNNRLWVIGRIGYVYSVGLGTDEWMTLPGLHFQAESSDGKQWFILRASEVVSYDPATGKWELYTAEELQLRFIESLFVSSQGLIWVTGRHQDAAAIAVFDGTQWRHFSHPEFARWIEPHSAFEAADGTVWFGAGGPLLSGVPGAGGALQYEVDVTGRPRLLKHHAQPELPYYVTTLAQTADRSLWIGSTVVHRLEEGAQSATPVRGLGGENSVAMTVDRNGELWVAKEHYGVCRRLENSWEVFGTEDGLASLLFSDLLALSDGTLLVSSDRGISWFDGQSWSTLAYPAWFGMGQRRSSMLRASDGALWFNFSDDEVRSPLLVQGGGQRSGAVRHLPEGTPPKTQIPDYLEKVAPPGNTHINWTADDPWGETPKELLQYSWRLGAGPWSVFSEETGHSFLNLDHGRYVLEVRARDRAYNVDPTPACAEFFVEAPVWLRPWFIGMVALIIFGSSAFIWMMVYFHEKRLKERARHLAEVDRLKTGFYTNISHELNTPLTSILVPLERLVSRETDEGKKKRLSLVLRNAHRMANLVGQLLDIRKLEQGTIALDVMEGDLVEHVRATIELMVSVSQTNRVTCRVEGAEVCFGWFDPDKLKKIVQNLVGNALKYTRPGGNVRVWMNRVEDETGGPVFLLVVEDTGAGIKPEHLDRVFDRFYRVSEQSIVQGSGIGLNLTQEQVELWGGTIRVESPIHSNEECPGTRFTVRLPIDHDELLKQGAHENETV